jgi:hypothetical protein
MEEERKRRQSAMRIEIVYRFVFCVIFAIISSLESAWKFLSSLCVWVLACWSMVDLVLCTCCFDHIYMFCTWLIWLWLHDEFCCYASLLCFSLSSHLSVMLEKGCCQCALCLCYMFFVCLVESLYCVCLVLEDSWIICFFNVYANAHYRSRERKYAKGKFSYVYFSSEFYIVKSRVFNDDVQLAV